MLNFSVSQYFSKGVLSYLLLLWLLLSFLFVSFGGFHSSEITLSSLLSDFATEFGGLCQCAFRAQRPMSRYIRALRADPQSISSPPHANQSSEIGSIRFQTLCSRACRHGVYLCFIFLFLGVVALGIPRRRHNWCKPTLVLRSVALLTQSPREPIPSSLSSAPLPGSPPSPAPHPSPSTCTSTSTFSFCVLPGTVSA